MLITKKPGTFVTHRTSIMQWCPIVAVSIQYYLSISRQNSPAPSTDYRGIK